MDRDPGAIARPQRADTRPVDLGQPGHEGARGCRVVDRFGHQNPAPRALAVAVAAHVETQRHIAETGEQAGGGQAGALVLVRAKAVQHHEPGAPFALRQIVRNMHDAGQRQPVGREGDRFFQCPALRLSRQNSSDNKRSAKAREPRRGDVRFTGGGVRALSDCGPNTELALTAGFDPKAIFRG